MTDKSKRSVTELEIVNLRHNLSLLHSQAKSGRLNQDFLTRQIDKLDHVLKRVGDEQKHKASAGRFEALYNVSRVLGSSLNLQTVLDQVMDAIIQLTGAERGFLMLRNDDGGITVQAARNIDQQSLVDEEFQFSRTITNQVIDNGTPILTTNASEDPRFSGQASIVTQALRSIMATPLRARGNVIGAIYVDNRALAGLFSDEDLAALDAFSAQAAIALDNAKLFRATDEELSERVDQLRQLRRIDRLLGETLDADEAIGYTLEWACRLSDATHGHFGVLVGDKSQVYAAHHYGFTEAEQKPEWLHEKYPNIKIVIETSQTYHDNPKEGETSILIVPVLRENKILGVMVLSAEDGKPFTDEQQDLVQRIVARAAVSIENAQLYAAVQQADIAKSEFVGIVAHDLKSPMTSIKGYADLMLLEDHLSDRYIQFLTRIKNMVGRMEILVSDLADISRIESGHFFMDETRVSVADVIQAVKDGTLPQIEEREHTFVEDIEVDLPDMSVDYYRLLQVLTNLVSNAYKYTPNGGTITLSVKRKNDRIQFVVKDTGIGLSKRQVAILGTKFWRAEDEYTRSQPGTGLGFSITSSLIEQMGDQIHIESEKGKGSTFCFRVQIAKD